MVELVLHTPVERVETVSDALLELGALSVAVEDADADARDAQPLWGEPGLPASRPGWRRSALRALFTDAPAVTEAATLLLAQPFGASVRLVTVEDVAEVDWVRLTQQQFAPVPIAPGFWIVPSWHEPPADASRVIRLDPGLAFGTGTHPTTRMCLRWIAAHPQAWSRVLDYGCGSGILAIAAALHGGRGIDAVDVDPAAVAAAQANAAVNRVSLTAGEPELATGRYPLVLANILASPLKLLAPLLAGHVAPGGELVLAGMLERQAGEMKAAYAPWLQIDVVDADEGWALMSGRAAWRA